MATDIVLSRSAALPGFFGAVHELPAPSDDAETLDIIHGADAPSGDIPSYDVLFRNTQERLSRPIADRRELSPAMMARASMAWRVSEHEVYCRVGERQAKRIDGYKLLKRDDTGDDLSVVSDTYGVVQNVDAFTPFDDLVASGRAEYVGAGAFNGGRQVWATARLAGDGDIVPGDRTVPLLMLRTGHGSDGGSVKGSLMFQRLVCLNGNTARESFKLFNVRHTRNAVRRVRISGDTVRAVFDEAEKHMQLFRRMARVVMPKDAFRAYVASVLPLPENPAEHPRMVANVERMRARVAELAEGGRGTELPGVRGTLWGAYNALTEFSDHVRDRRGDSEARVRSLWFGVGAELKNRALTEATALAR